MDDLQTDVTKELRGITERLEVTRQMLWETHGRLPASPQEDVMLCGEEEPDFSCRVRIAIECSIADHLRPLIDSLRNATAEEEG